MTPLPAQLRPQVVLLPRESAAFPIWPWLFGGIGLGVAVLAVGVWWRRRERASGAGGGVPAPTVTPFADEGRVSPPDFGDAEGQALVMILVKRPAAQTILNYQDLIPAQVTGP